MLRRVVPALVVVVLVAAGSVATSVSTAGTTASAAPGSTAVPGLTGASLVGLPTLLIAAEQLLSMAVVALVLLGFGTGVAWYAGVLPGSQEQDGEAATEEPANVDGLTTDAETVEPDTTEEPQQELLSDEDHVLQLLEEHGGRMKQVHIVEQTDWSKSKVSMLLSDMEDGGEISKLRVGRENIISLAGEEPEAAGSPFEEE